MRKISIVLALLLLIVPVFISAEDNKDGGGLSKGAWVVIGADIALTTAAVLAVMQQNTLATDYETLKSKIDGTTEAGYYRLLYEKEKVDSAGDIALIAGCAAGAAIAMTVIDIFFTHHAFHNLASIEVKPSAEGASLGLAGKF